MALVVYQGPQSSSLLSEESHNAKDNTSAKRFVGLVSEYL